MKTSEVVEGETYNSKFGPVVALESGKAKIFVRRADGYVDLVRPCTLRAIPAPVAPRVRSTDDETRTCQIMRRVACKMPRAKSAPRAPVLKFAMIAAGIVASVLPVALQMMEVISWKL